MIPVSPARYICWMLSLSDMLSARQLSLVAVGNRTMGDDGIAPVIVEVLQENLSSGIDVQIWENADALSIAAELLTIDKTIVLVDCADMGLPSGEFRWFHQSECVLGEHLNLVSTHGFGFADALALAETLGFDQDMYFFAIQPERIEFTDKLSKCLQENIPRLAAALSTQLERLMAVAL